MYRCPEPTLDNACQHVYRITARNAQRQPHQRQLYSCAWHLVSRATSSFPIARVLRKHAGLSYIQALNAKACPPPPPLPPYTCRPARTPQLFIDSYNKRKPDNKLDSAECHLEVGSGRALAQGDTIGEAITDRADVHVRSGATEEGGGAAASAAAAAEASSAVDGKPVRLREEL